MAILVKVLVIGYVWPEPNSSAAGSHICSIMQLFVEQGWQVEFASPAQKTAHMQNLSEMGISHNEINLNCDSFDKYITDLSPNIVMFDRFMMEEQFGWRVDKYCPNALKILDTEDLQCVRQARHQAIKELVPFSNTKLLESELAKREIAAILRCDISLIISDYEMTLLSQVFKVDNALLHYLPFMLDTKKLTKSPTFKERKHFVTIGNFRHAPNWDSVLYLNQLWPKIRSKLPSAELHIYGSYPPPKATALSNAQKGFIVKGWCENAFDVIEQAKVMLSPLRFGAGIKGKFLDAMQCQTPSITTEVGIEGMFSAPNWPGLVANNDDDIINAAISLYSDESLWQKKASLCHPKIREKFDKTELTRALVDKINHTIADLNSHRLNNFTGQMLKHHSHASTRYMSQWINEKNKHRN